MTDYVTDFVQESDEQITELNNALLTLERDPDDDEAMENIFRIAHTLKGNCSAMGLESASDLAHAIEDLLDAVRAGTLDVTSELMDVVFDAVDELETMIDEVEATGEIETDPSATIEALRGQLGEPSGPPSIDPPSEDEIDDVLSRFDPPADDEHDAYLARLAITPDEEINNGPLVVEALIDAFDMIGTVPGRERIDADEYGGWFDAVFGSAVGEAAIRSGLEPVDEVTDFEIVDVTDRFDAAVVGSDGATDGTADEAQPVADEDLADGLSNEEAQDLEVDELLDQFDEFDDLDEKVEELEDDDLDAFDEMGDAGSFDDLLDEADVEDEPAPHSDDETQAAESADVAAGDPASGGNEEVDDAGAVFEELKDEVEMVGFDELQDELEELEFDEFDDEDEVDMDELLGEDVDLDDDSFLEDEPSDDAIDEMLGDDSPADADDVLGDDESPEAVDAAVDSDDALVEDDSAIDAGADAAADENGSIEPDADEKSPIEEADSEPIEPEDSGSVDATDDAVEAEPVGEEIDDASAADSDVEAAFDDTAAVADDDVAIDEPAADDEDDDLEVDESVADDVAETDDSVETGFEASDAGTIESDDFAVDEADSFRDGFDDQFEDEDTFDDDAFDDDVIDDEGFEDDSFDDDAFDDVLDDTGFENDDAIADGEFDTPDTEFDAADDPVDAFGDDAVDTADEDDVVRVVDEPEFEIPDVTIPEQSDQPDAEQQTDEIQSVRVDVEQIDSLLTLVEGLVTSRVRLRHAIETGQDLQAIAAELDDLEDLTTDLQETVMDVRLVPLETVANRLPRVVRDIARGQNKEVAFEMTGENVELDRSILDRIGDPLIHLVRNAVDHGIEPPEAREDVDKSREGTVSVSADRSRDQVRITVSDDGSGLDPDRLRSEAVDADILTEDEAADLPDDEAYDLIFHPGLSTADEVTDVSGRGVGMDVVKRTIEDLNGSVEIDSEAGAGTTVTMTLPVSVAIDDILFVECGGEEFGVPTKAVADIEDASVIEARDGEPVLSDEEEEEWSLVQLDEVLDTPRAGANGDGMIVRIRDEVRPIALHCDHVHGQQEVVVKPFEGFMRGIPGLSGATVRGRGEVVNILDVTTL